MQQERSSKEKKVNEYIGEVPSNNEFLHFAMIGTGLEPAV